VLRFFFAQNRKIDEDINGKRKESDDSDKDNKSDAPKQKGIFDWEKVVDWVATELRMSWEEVMKMNPYKFNHRVKYLTNKAKEKYSIQMKQMNNAKRVRRS
jgi:hypothetical protein